MITSGLKLNSSLKILNLAYNNIQDECGTLVAKIV